MTPERYQRAVEIFQAALEMPSSDRSAYLERACAADLELRREVQFLLDGDMQSASVLSQGPAALAEELVERPSASAGERIGPYEIVAPIGAGGMGEVYRARDSSLGREVAVKLLPTIFARDPERMRRFEQEARAAGMLNHPNILTVHTAGVRNGSPYIASELLEGETLRERLGKEPLGSRRAIEYAIQIANGLDAAHEKGVVHRDLKPENLFITRDGRVKILDFGLAKLVQTGDLGWRTISGIVLGTPGYMAPEQVRGAEADHRSDLFALGAILYEMVTGRRAFARPSAAETMNAVIHDEPPDMADSAAAPSGLNNVIRRCLEKGPEQRFQTARDLAFHLETLLSAPPMVAVPLARKRTRPFVWLWAIALMAVAIVAGVFAILQRYQRPASIVRDYMQLTNFADSATSPALSPDGRILAFLRAPETFAGRGEIWVKLLPDGDPVQLTRDAKTKMSPIFNPAGDRIAYTVTTSMIDPMAWSTWTVPTLGGEPTLLLPNSSAVTWVAGTPPRLLFSEVDRGVHMSIVTATANRSEARTVYAPKTSDAMAHRSYLSPDGKWVLVVEMDGGWRPCRLAPFDSSSPGKLVGPSPSQCTTAAWSPDGRWMYFSANAGNGYHVWRQRFPNGEPEQVTFGATEEEGIAFAPDGKSFVTSVGIRQSTLSVRTENGERQITSEGYASLPQFSSNGKNLYYLLRSRANRRFVSGELWVTDLETGTRERLLPDFLMEHYRVSADGKRVVFVAIDEEGHTPVWLATLDRRTAPRRLSTLDAARAFFGAAGGVYFFGGQEGTNRSVYRIQEDGSGLQPATSEPVTYLYDVSPDGKSLAVWAAGPVLVYSTAGEPPVVVSTLCSAAGGENRGITPPCVSWSPDGRFIYLYLRLERKMCVAPLERGRNLPSLPRSGIRSMSDAVNLPGARIIPEDLAFMGPNPSIYAIPRITTHRNIFRVPTP